MKKSGIFIKMPTENPEKTERILSRLIEPREQSDFCHRIVQFGRDTCMARGPRCEGCPLGEVCRHNGKPAHK